MKQILKFLFIISIFLIGSESVYSESSKPLSDEIRDQGMRGENGVPLNTSEKKVPDEVRPANTKQNTICSEYIQNGAFIDGEEWFGSPSANVTLTTLDGGEKVAAISTKNDNTAYLWQPLYIPHGAVDGSLSFRVESPSQEYSGEDLYISFWDENNYAPVMNQALIDSVPLSGWNDFNFMIVLFGLMIYHLMFVLGRLHDQIAMNQIMDLAKQHVSIITLRNLSTALTPQMTEIGFILHLMKHHLCV